VSIEENNKKVIIKKFEKKFVKTRVICLTNAVDIGRIYFEVSYAVRAV